MVSLAPPPVAPTWRLPPALIVPVLAGWTRPCSPPPLPLEPLEPPQAASRPPALSIAPPARAPCSTWRRVRPSRNSSLENS